MEVALRVMLAHSLIALIAVLCAALILVVRARRRRERDYRRGHSDYSKFERRRGWFG
jgi:hypothetical protein